MRSEQRHEHTNTMSLPHPITARLNLDHLRAVEAVKMKAEQLLDHSPRFRYFTLHGKQHIESLFRILGMLIDGGITLNERELYLLSLAICTHDLGMVVSLRDFDLNTIAEGRPGFTDPVMFENFVRETHHLLIAEYFSRDLNFLISLGITPPDLSIIGEIGKAHRRVNLDSLHGLEQKLGALMRAIDELDVGPSRAPMGVLENIADELDNLSCWHWFKHNITLDWDLGHNVTAFEQNRQKNIRFDLVVRPPTASSVPYWLTQVHRSLRKALVDEGASLIIERSFGVLLKVHRDSDQSRSSALGERWERLERRALSHGRNVVLVVDDEVNKYDDLFYPVMEKYHVVRAPNAKAAIAALEATNISLAILDLQMGSGGIWTESETKDFKLTGLELAKVINERFPSVKVGILTGTRHPLPDISHLKLSFFLKKPIMAEELMSNLTAQMEVNTGENEHSH